MKAVIYARFSCSKQREESIEDQIRVCREWADAKGCAVVGEYADEAVSGRTDQRPEFQRMIENAGESDIVLVYMMDRFSRDPYDAPYYKSLLSKKGVRVVSATEPILDTPDGILVEKIYEGLAAVESAHISQRTLRGMEGNAMKCKWNGVPVYGYSVSQDGRYEIDEAQACIVRECFSRRLNGEAVNSIAADLASRGVRTTTGKPASHTFVNSMLKNRKYAGVYSWGSVTVPDGMPAIVSPDVFDAVQHVKGRKCRKEETWHDYPLSGGKALCGCGCALAGVSTLKGDTRYHYYRCRNCGSRMRADVLESSVVSCVRSLLSDREEAVEVARQVGEHVSSTEAHAQLEAAKARQREADNGLKNMINAIAQGIDPALARQKVEELQAELESADREVEMLSASTWFDVEDFADFLQYGATLDDVSVIETFVQRVTVGETLTVFLNYSLGGEPAIYRSTNLPEEVGTDCVWLPTGENVPTVGVSQLGICLRPSCAGSR